MEYCLCDVIDILPFIINYNKKDEIVKKVFYVFRSPFIPYDDLKNRNQETYEYLSQLKGYYIIYLLFRSYATEEELEKGELTKEKVKDLKDEWDLNKYPKMIEDYIANSMIESSQK